MDWFFLSLIIMLLLYERGRWLLVLGVFSASIILLLASHPQVMTVIGCVMILIGILMRGRRH